MKKKYITALLVSMAMLTSMAGCGKGNREVAPDTENETTEALNNEAAEATEKDAAKAEASTEASTESLSDSNSDSNEDNASAPRYYSLNYDNTTLYVVDENGDLENQYDLLELEKVLNEKFPGIGLEANDYSLYDNGILYFTNYYYAYKGNGTNYGAIYALDPKSGEVVEICRRDEEYIADLDIYKGKLFFKTMPSGTKHFVEHCYEIKDGLEFAEADSGLGVYYSATRDYDICSRTNFRISDCIPRRFDEFGFDIVKKDNVLYKADIDGKLMKVYEAEEDNAVYLDYFDSEMMVFHLYDDNYHQLGYFKLDMASGETSLISDDEDKHFFGFDKNVCYYTVDDKMGLDMFKRQLFFHDLTDGSDKLIMEETTVPGTNTTDILSNYHSIFGKKIFVPHFEEDEYVWNIIDPKEASPAPKSLGYVAESFPVFDYGTVEYVNADYKCPDCGIELYMFYGEKFVLDPGYSDHAEEINKVIAEYVDGRENVSVNDLMFADTTCEDHQEFPQMNCETEDNHVTQVSVINDRYLEVFYNSYFYFGGAHGESMKEQFLFDLKTGERKQLSDFYKGSKEDFKKLVADMVKEDFATAEPSKYFAETEEEVWQQAYDSADIDDRAVFGEEGIDYMFYPYDLGPYASGFITMHVSYEELLGRKTLAE